MSRYRRAAVPGASYFFTVVTERRQPILTDPAVRQALREAIVSVRHTLPFRIDGWVLLPDHLHAIWTLPDGDSDYSNRWRLIKRQVTRACGPDFIRPGYLTKRRSAKQCGTLWQHRFWEHLIRDERDFRLHMDYLHANPGEAWARAVGRGLAVVVVSPLCTARHLSARLDGRDE